MIESILNKDIESIIEYSFKKKDNLKNSLIHPSSYKDKKNKSINHLYEFERLEFLGDKILGLSVASLIFYKFNDFNEGGLTKKLSYLVQRDFLYKIALELKLDNFLKYSRKRESNRMNKSILADSVESLIGSIYVDGGYNSAFKFIKKFWSPYLNLQESNEQDPKTKLQEISQQKFKKLPEYKLIKKTGPSHSPVFTVSLKALKMNLVKASGRSIREAQKEAAKKILDLINGK
jgi:ribonuclease-3